jgi:hypothetical protein
MTPTLTLVPPETEQETEQATEQATEQEQTPQRPRRALPALSRPQWMGVVAAIVILVASTSTLISRSPKQTYEPLPVVSADPVPSVEPVPSVVPDVPDVSPVPSAKPQPVVPSSRALSYSEHRSEYYFATLPKGWKVTGETANGIDISPPDSLATASFAYVKGSLAGANFYGVGTDNDGFATWTMRNAGADVVFSDVTSLGSYTDAIGVSWTFDGRNFEGTTANGDAIKGVLEIGTATDQFGTWVGMAWLRVARSDKWDAYKTDLAATARSIVLQKVDSTAGGSIRMPATDTSSGELSGTQSDVEDRLSHDRAAATRGYQTMTDPTTGDRYDVPLTSYDASRGGYFIEKSTGAQELESDY